LAAIGLPLTVPGDGLGATAGLEAGAKWLKVGGGSGVLMHGSQPVSLYSSIFLSFMVTTDRKRLPTPYPK
jgi:hypothetical protein